MGLIGTTTALHSQAASVTSHLPMPSTAESKALAVSVAPLKFRKTPPDVTPGSSIWKVGAAWLSSSSHSMCDFPSSSLTKTPAIWCRLLPVWTLSSAETIV